VLNAEIMRLLEAALRGVFCALGTGRLPQDNAYSDVNRDKVNQIPSSRG